MDMYERFERTSLSIEQDKFYQEKIDKLNLPKLQKDYEEALQNLKIECRNICFCDNNVFVYNSIDRYAYLTKSCFSDDISDEQKAKKYKKIKKFLLAKDKAEKLFKENRKQKEILYNNKPHSVTNSNLLVPNFQGNHIPKVIAKFLYCLCGGDTKKIEQFAIFTYDILYHQRDSSSVVIFAKKEVHAALKDYFNYLFNFTCWYTDFAKLYFEANSINMPLYNLANNPPAIIIENTEIYISEPYVSCLRKLLNGKTIKLNSPFFEDEIVIKNRLPVIYITANEEKYLTMKNLYKSKGLIFDSDEVIRLPYDPELIIWLKNEFSYLGYMWSNNVSHFKMPDFDYRSSVKEFLENCCIFEKDLQCTKKELHEAYCRYFAQRYNIAPLSQIKFCKIVSELKCGQIEAFRPHPNRQTHLHSFKGIALRKDLCNNTFSSKNTIKPKKNYEEISEEINKIIDDISINPTTRTFNV